MGATTAVSPARPQINIGFVVLISAAAALGGFLFGFDSAVINGAVPGIQVTFAASARRVPVASLLLGAALGALRRAGRFSDRIGRKRTMLSPASCSLVTAVGTGLCPRHRPFTLFRFVSGMARGHGQRRRPGLHRRDFARGDARAPDLAATMGIVVGILIAFLVDYWITLAAGGVTEPFWFGLEAWRCMFLTEAIPAASPSSAPRW